MQIVLSCVCLLLYQTSQAERSVLERGLVVADPQWKDIVKEERRYCQQAVTKHTFQGPVLGYITPWNSHGYDVAKVFGSKLTSVSPVWLQLRRRGSESFHITGLHDNDPGKGDPMCHRLTTLMPAKVVTLSDKVAMPKTCVLREYM
uniref:Chitinase domain containing 1 n=1 Tax=Hucho hucho TaxID=62062 RepID=A0A4W5LR00_9TELE